MRPNRTKNGSQELVLVWVGFGFFRFRELDFKTLDQILEVQVRPRKVVGHVSVFIDIHLVFCWQTGIWQFIYAHTILFRRLRLCLSIRGIYRVSVLLPQAS
jgi:hypothetical protein